MKFTAIIPARFASTRFPGKPLAVLGGKTVIEHVYEKAKATLDDAWVATDDERIEKAVSSFGGKVIMTSTEHKSGTDRIAEAARLMDCQSDVIVNIQGDEPFIHPSQIEAVCKCFDDESTQIATLGKPFTSSQDYAALQNPNSPKIVTDLNGFAMYFSRSIIPYIRGHEASEWLSCHTFLKHIGLYAYRNKTLQEITRLAPTPLELAESLEQLRWLQHGYSIRVGITHEETIGIDTPEDLERAEKYLKQMEA